MCACVHLCACVKELLRISFTKPWIPLSHSFSVRGLCTANLKPHSGCFHSTSHPLPVQVPDLNFVLRHVSTTKATQKGVNQRSKDVTQMQQQRPELPTVALTCHATKCKVHKLHKMYILCGPNKNKNSILQQVPYPRPPPTPFTFEACQTEHSALCAHSVRG